MRTDLARRMLWGASMKTVKRKACSGPPKLGAAILLCGSLALGCGGDNPKPDPTQGDITGVVLDPHTSAPVVGATVTTDPASGTVVTDADGHFVLSDVEPGTYVVVITVDGTVYAHFESVVVAAGQQTQLQPDALCRIYPTTCLGCHLDREALIASIEEDPLPVVTEAGSAGEG